VNTGFFSPTQLASKSSVPMLPQCGRCGLYRYCDSPKMPVYGDGRRKILVVGQSPGAHEDRQHRPFSPDGDAGGLLHDMLGKLGVNLYRDCWVTNALRCRPWEMSKAQNVVNRTPTRLEVGYCRPFLIQALEELEPETVVLLGAEAVQSMIGWLWKDNVGTVSRWRGWRIPCQKLNAWVCPTWHPSFIMRTDYGESGERGDDWKGDRDNETRKGIFERDLQAAFETNGRPWQEVPDYKKQVKLIHDPVQAAFYIRQFAKSSRPVAFDYENSPLKPDRSDSWISCCSMSNGKHTIAYPWLGEAVVATGEFLKSDVPKVASNMKHETRWSMRHFGFRPRNWVFDTMLAAHTLDNRPDITSVKFQAFVLLGQELWNKDVEPFFDSKGSNEHNRIKEIPLERILTYCGMDSLMEILVAKKQAKQLKVEL
jgi:uracil-DNA glycosylase family 4